MGGHPEPDGWTPGTWWVDTWNLMDGHPEYTHAGKKPHPTTAYPCLASTSPLTVGGHPGSPLHIVGQHDGWTGGHPEPDGWTPGIYLRREETTPDHSIPLSSINLSSYRRRTPGLSPPYSGATWWVDGRTPGTWWVDTRNILTPGRSRSRPQHTRNLMDGHPEPDGWTPGIYLRREETAPDHSIPLSSINLSS